MVIFEEGKKQEGKRVMKLKNEILGDENEEISEEGVEEVEVKKVEIEYKRVNGMEMGSYLRKMV